MTNNATILNILIHINNKMNDYELIKREDNIIGKCYNISKMYEVGFGGNIDKLYDIKYCVCTWWMLNIIERDENSPLILEKWSRGEYFGLTIWDILEKYTYDMYFKDIDNDYWNPTNEYNKQSFYKYSESIQYANKN